MPGGNRGLVPFAGPRASKFTAFLAYLTADQTGFSDASWTGINFNATLLDTSAAFNTSTSIYTVPKSGNWLIIVFARYTGTVSVGGVTGAGVSINGASVAAGGANAPNSFGPSLSNQGAWVLVRPMRLSKGDTAQAYGYFDVSSGTGTVASDTFRSYFAMIYLGA